MSYAIRTSDGWEEIFGSFKTGRGDSAIQRAANWPDLASDEEREAVGVAEIVEPGAPPSDVAVVGSTLAGEDIPIRTWTIQQPGLDDLKSQYRQRAEAIRDQHLNGGCATPSGPVDTDLESRMNISGSVQMASILGAAFSATWRRADNTYIVLNASEMAAVGMAAGQHVATCYSACFAIKDAITGAASLDAVRAIDLNAGYPA